MYNNSKSNEKTLSDFVMLVGPKGEGITFWEKSGHILMIPNFLKGSLVEAGTLQVLSSQPIYYTEKHLSAYFH